MNGAMIPPSVTFRNGLTGRGASGRRCPSRRRRRPGVQAIRAIIGAVPARSIERSFYVSIIVALLLFLAWREVLPLVRRQLPTTPDTFEIKDVIHAVHTQLIESQREREAAGRSPLFLVRSFDLELQATIKSQSIGSGKFETKILALGTENSSTRERATKITLHMETIGFEGARWQAERSAATPGAPYGSSEPPQPRPISPAWPPGSMPGPPGAPPLGISPTAPAAVPPSPRFGAPLGAMPAPPPLPLPPGAMPKVQK